MMLEYTAHAAASEARSLASPMAVQSVWASLGVESHASLAATAAVRTAELLRAMRVLVATELVVAMRALALAERRPSGAGVQALFEAAARAHPGRQRGPRLRPGRGGCGRGAVERGRALTGAGASRPPVAR